MGGEGLRAGDDEFPDACLVPASDLDAAPLFLDELFHGADENAGLAAFSALAAEAVEVRVGATVPAGGVGDPET